MSFSDQIHKSIKYSLIILLFFTGTAFTQPPPGFSDYNNRSHDNTERNEIKKLDIGLIFQNSELSYDDGQNIDKSEYFLPAFHYEESKNLINSKRFSMVFNSYYCHYKTKSDYGIYDNEYLEMELEANVKKYFSELFFGGGLYTYNWFSDFVFLSYSIDLMLGFDSRTEYISLLTPLKTYREGFYSELALRKNFYYNDSDYDPSKIHASIGYVWADGDLNYINSIYGKLEFPVGSEKYTKFYLSNDFRLDLYSSMSLGLYLDAGYLYNDFGSQSEFNLKPDIKYYFKKTYIQPFYNFKSINYRYTHEEEYSQNKSTLGLKIALYWNE